MKAKKIGPEVRALLDALGLGEDILVKSIKIGPKRAKVEVIASDPCGAVGSTVLRFLVDTTPPRKAP